MNNQEMIAIKNCINLLIDKKWHNIYDLHTKYNLLPISIFKSIDFLEKNNMIVLKKNRIRLSKELTNTQAAVINRIFKTQKPDNLIRGVIDVNH
jgi:predicted transcriptional regulator